MLKYYHFPSFFDFRLCWNNDQIMVDTYWQKHVDQTSIKGSKLEFNRISLISELRNKQNNPDLFNKGFGFGNKAISCHLDKQGKIKVMRIRGNNTNSCHISNSDDNVYTYPHKDGGGKDIAND